MRNSDSRKILKTTTALILLIGALFFLDANAQAEGSAGDEIEVVYPPNADLPYRDRRQTWGFLWGFNMVSMWPSKMMTDTTVATNPTQINFSDRFIGQRLSVFEIETLAKLNFSMGSIGAGIILGSGSKKIDGSGSLSVLKKGFAGYIFLDSIFAEPYVVPYVGSQFFQMDYSDIYSAGTIERKGTLGFSTAVQAGLMFQMNGLDRTTAFRARQAFGVENTYLDLFVIQHASNPTTGQPNMTTGFDYGFGFRIEH